VARPSGCSIEARLDEHVEMSLDAADISVRATFRWLPSMLLILSTASAAPPPKTTPTQVRISAWLEHDSAHQLQAADFHATIDGAESRILGLDCPDGDLVLLLVLDLSSGDLTMIDPAKAALLDEIHKLPPKTFVGLLSASDGLHVLKDPTADRESIAAEISAPILAGKTGLLPTVDAIESVGDAMLKKSAARVAVLYITDGDVRNYREDFTNPVINSSDSHDLSRRFPETLVQEKIAKLDALLAARETPLFIAELNQRTDRLNQAYHNGLKQLAETTGGAAFFSRSFTEIPADISKSFETVQSHYSFTLAVPERASARLQIRLTGPESERLVSYRTRLLLHSSK
jgi:hypothetical protein